MISRRTVEWSSLSLVILVLIVVFTRQARITHAQSEFAAVQSTLGALRVALVVGHLKNAVSAAPLSVSKLQHNPFELLERRPVNYWGDTSGTGPSQPPPGNWVFDSACGCVGYSPVNDDWLENPSSDGMAWFEVTGAQGPLQLVAKDDYSWRGQVLK